MGHVGRYDGYGPGIIHCWPFLRGGGRKDEFGLGWGCMQTFHPLASVTVAGCHFTRSKWGCETLAYPSNLRSKDTQP